MALAALAAAVLGQRAFPPVEAGAGPEVGAIPAALTAVVSARLGAAGASFAVAPARDGKLSARGGGLTTAFGRTGIVVRGPGGALRLLAPTLGRGGSAAPLPVAPPIASGSSVDYRRGAVREWYRNGPFGLEQGFTLAVRPAGSGELALGIPTAGSLVPRLAGAEVVLDAPGARAVLRYAGLSAVDADGQPLPTRLDLAGRTIVLRVDDRGARYPVIIDPFVQQGGKLGGRWGFGTSVALSADGSTALVGAPFASDSPGEAWVYVRSGAAWTQQGAKLVSGATGGKDGFGQSVALSADGSTALVGAALGGGDKPSAGAAWIFTRSGGSWSRQAKLVPRDELGAGSFGWSVALTAAGDGALVGGPADDGSKGAAWYFTRPAAGWAGSPAQAKLVPAGATGAAAFGWSVALASDASVALIGGPGDAGKAGAAWAFASSGGWSQQGGKLTGAGAQGAGAFGSSVALDGAGALGMVGAPADAGGAGAVWTYAHAGAGWTVQGAKLTGPVAARGSFGASVALDTAGKTALIGAPNDDGGGSGGAALLFSRSGKAWAADGSSLAGAGQTGSLGAAFGSAAALAGDGRTAIVGGYADADYEGAAWVFASSAPGAAAPAATTPAATTQAAATTAASPTVPAPTTPPGAPGKPTVWHDSNGGTHVLQPSIHAVGIEVSWTAPKTRPGETILGYLVSANAVDSRKAYIKPTTALGCFGYRPANAARPAKVLTSCELFGLFPGYTYALTVKAATVAGYGPPSAITYVSTPQPSLGYRGYKR